MFVSFDPPSAWMLKICSWRRTGNTEHTWHTGEVATPPVLLVTPVQSSRWLSASWETQTLRRSCSQVENSTPVHCACVCVCETAAVCYFCLSLFVCRSSVLTQWNVVGPDLRSSFTCRILDDVTKLQNSVFISAREQSLCSDWSDELQLFKCSSVTK